MLLGGPSISCLLCALVLSVITVEAVLIEELPESIDDDVDSGENDAPSSEQKEATNTSSAEGMVENENSIKQNGIKQS